MEVRGFDDKDLLMTAIEIETIGNMAISGVRADNRTRGIPIVYSVNDKIYYEMPDGRITSTSPFN